MSLESELKIANRKLKTEARKLEKVQSELDSCKEKKILAQEEAVKAQHLIDDLKKKEKFEENGSEVHRKKTKAGSQLHEACSIIVKLAQLQDVFKIIGIALLYLTGAITKDFNHKDPQLVPSDSPLLGRSKGKLWRCLGELIQKSSISKTRLSLPLLQMVIAKNAKESTAGECKMKNGSASAAMSQTSWCDRQLQYACSDPSRIQTELVCGMFGVNSLKHSS